MWGGNEAKLMLGKFVDFLNKFQVKLPDDSSLVAHLKNLVQKKHRKRRIESILRMPYEFVVGMLGHLTVGRPTYIPEEDWDYLIVLDACRHDTMESVLGTKVPFVYSPGSNTEDWVKANFVRHPEKRNLGDTVLVTASGFNSEEYFRFKEWEFPYYENFAFWSLQAKKDKPGIFEGTYMTPWEMVKKACSLLATGKYTGKRMMVHFIQPHFPPLTGYDKLKFDHPDAPGQFRAYWDLVETGEISVELAREFYEENLILVLDWVFRLVDVLPGKVVITADHGNLFGEYGLFAHPRLCVPELRKIPWLEMEGGGKDPATVLKQMEDAGL